MASFSHPCLSMIRQACHKNKFPQIKFPFHLFVWCCVHMFRGLTTLLRSSRQESHNSAPVSEATATGRLQVSPTVPTMSCSTGCAGRGAFNTELDQLIETSIEYTQSLSLNSSQSNYSTILLTQITFPFVGSYCSVTKAIWLLKNWILRQLCPPCRFHFFTSSSLSWGSTGHEKPVTLDTPSYPYITCLSSCLM